LKNATDQNHIVKVVYTHISQFIHGIKGNCVQDATTEEEIEAVTCSTCRDVVEDRNLMETDVYAMVKSDVDGIGTLLLLLNDMNIDKKYRDMQFEEIANEWSNLVE
jgi:hypothetical protein